MAGHDSNPSRVVHRSQNAAHFPMLEEPDAQYATLGDLLAQE